MCVVAAIPAVVGMLASGAGSGALGATAAGVMGSMAGALGTTASTLGTVIGMGTSLLGAGMQMMQAKSEADAQNDYAVAQAEAANRAAKADYNSINANIQQQDQKTALEQTERMRQGIRERAKLAVAAGEAGISGASPMRELAVSLTGAGYDVGIMEANQENVRAQAHNEKRGVLAQNKSRVNEARSSMVTDTGMRMAAAGVAGLGESLNIGMKMNAGSSHGFLLEHYDDDFIKPPYISRLNYA